MGDNQDEINHERFFTVKQDEKNKEGDNHSMSIEHGSIGSDEEAKTHCWTLRIVQHMLPCLQKKGVWEPSQGDVFKSHDAEESKYPRILKFLENRILDYIFIFSCLMSIYLFLFSEGFLLESRLLWGIMHLVNSVYAFGLFCQWLQILIKSKYAKTNHGYTTRDIVYTILSVFPADLVVLSIYTLNDKNDNEVDSLATNPITPMMITLSRLNYFLRIRNIMQYFSKWENHLVIGDFKMFLIRTAFFSTFLLHLFACGWHRIACRSFQLSHLKMSPDEATVEVCDKGTWIGDLNMKDSILLKHPNWNVLVTHYLVSVYWTIKTCFRFGASDIHTTLSSDCEVAFVSFVEITAWIFILAHVNGALASLFIEKDTERQSFLTRMFSIRIFMKQFGEIAKFVQDDVIKFYNYLWERNSGILNVDLMDMMPQAMKAEVFYDVNKFVLDQLPLLKGLEIPFLMSLSVHAKHRFYMSGEILFRRNETALAMYFLVKGHLEVLTEDERHAITTIRSGSVIGECNLLQPYLHVATVRCGSDCEIRILSRKHFKEVLNIYPQYTPLLLQRLESRLEQCGLLLALCEKHNTYQQAFNRLREFQMDRGSSMDFHRSDLSHSFENVTRILQPGGGASDKVRQSQYSYDFDGISIGGEIENQLNQSLLSDHQLQDKINHEEMLVAAYYALENDVARAVALANDLNIPRPPLIVSSPETSPHLTLSFKQEAISGNACVSVVRQLKDPQKGDVNFAWKAFVSCCALLVFWYYPYQFAFKNSHSVLLDQAAHITDFVFALDCIYDMMQIVVTPQRNFESCWDIAVYRFKSAYFYLRIFSFIPFEYIIGPTIIRALGGEHARYPYIFKSNRLIEMHLVFRFMQEFEVRFRVKPILTVIGKFALGLFFVTHIFAVCHSSVMLTGKDIELEYREAFYWSIVVVTSLGYGDIPYETNPQLIVEVLGLIVGVCSLIYLAAKATAILANGERKRISFKQSFYSLEAFMKHRKFPRGLYNRVTAYYNLQWGAHQGTLIPSERSVIWDAPKSVKSRIGHAQAHKYVSRIPLFMYCPVYLQNEICVALKHYVIPPREILLHPSELARDLYIISKGFVEVISEGRQIAVFSEGRSFGLSGLLYGVNAPYKFKTLTHCQLFCLSYTDLMKVANLSPSFFHEVTFLQGNEKLSPFQPVDLLEDDSELPLYPTKSYMEKLVQVDLTVPTDDTPKSPGKRSGNVWSMKSKNPFANLYLLPNGTPLKFWMGFRVTFAIFITMYAPAQLAFPIPPEISYNVVMFFDIIALIDILLSLRIAYYGESNQLVTNSWKMATHYMKGPFLLDLLGCFPADMIAYFYLRKLKDYGKMYHVISLLRMNRMLQSYKVFLTNALLEKAMFKSLSFVMMIEMAPAMFMLINVASCFAILHVCGVSTDSKPFDCIDPDAWIINGLKTLDNDNFTDASHELQTTFRAYFIGVYWVTQSVLTVGYGDIPIKDGTANQQTANIVIFFGFILVAYAGGKLTSCIVGEDPKKIELQEKMALMHNYLEQQRASGNLRRRVREAYFNEWEKTNGVSPTNLFLALPPALKTDVMKQMYGATLRTSPLFENLDGPGLRMLASSLQEIFYPEGEFLMKFGDLCNDIFFIAYGAVVCYNVRGVIMCQLGSGSLLGETSSFFHNHRLYTAIAVKDVNAYVFKKESFMDFLNQYPSFKYLLETLSYQHYREAMMGTKKETADPNVAISFQNEVSSPMAAASKQTLSGIKSQTQSISRSYAPEDPSVTPSSASLSSKRSNKGKFVFMSRGGSGAVSNLQDLTRIPLKEDVLKNPDDLSKSTAEKWWSFFLTFGRKSRDEMGLLHIYQEKCNFFNFAVHPASAICKWVSIYLVITAFSCGITAYDIAFERNNNHDPEALFLFVIRDVLEVFFVIRIFGNFHLAYYDETATLITNYKTITRRYLSRIDGFWLDFITTCPFYLFGEIISHTLAEYARVLQLFRVVLFVRYLQETDSSLKMSAARVKIMKITILLCFIFHFWGCAWYLIACTGKYECSRGSWMHKTLNDLALTSNSTDPRSVTVLSRYLLSLYYVTNALTATGFAHITARTNIELCLSIIMMFGTVFVIGYLVGEMVQCLASQVANKIHYEHRLTVLENHFSYLGISSEKILMVREYFKLFWCRCKGVMLYNLVEELPYSLRADVAMEVYGPNLKSSRLLGKLDENLVRQICAQIRHEVYFPGSYIIRAGDVCTCMYFIKKGEVVVLDGNSNLELCVEILYENECFGEVKVLLPKEQYRFSYIARIESDVGILHKDDLESVLGNHPKLYDELREKANKVKARRQSKEEEEKTSVIGAHSLSSIRSGTQHGSGAVAADKKEK